MTRRHNPLPRRALPLQRIGRVAFTLFLLFVAFRILTPKSETLTKVESPDGTKTARLRRIHYVSEPSYKIDVRERGKVVWLNLLYLPVCTNVPAGAAKTLQWSADSRRLIFRANDEVVRTYRFAAPERNPRPSPPQSSSKRTSNR